MGRRKTTVTTMNQRMMESKDFKYSGQLAMNEWIWSKQGLGVSFDDKDLSDYFIEYHQNSLPKKMDKLYRWAEKPNRYFYGLPKSSIVNDPDTEYFKATVKYLRDIHGSIEIIANNIDEVEFYYTAWDRLVKDYGYDSQTNEIKNLSIQHGYTCYLKDAYLQVSQRTYDEFIEIGLDNPTLAFNFGQVPFLDRFTDVDREQTDAVIGDSDRLVLTYTYEQETLPESPLEGYIEPIKTIHEHTIEINLADVNPELLEGQTIPSDTDTVFITYYKDNKYYWFSYEIGSGLIPQIDSALTGSRVLGQYYPRVYFKHDSTEIYQHPETPRKKATLKGCKILGLNAKDTTQEIAKGIGGEYGNVRSLYLHLGVKINWVGDDSHQAEYCYRYFERLLSHFPQTEPNKISAGGIKIYDLVSSQDFYWSSIHKQEHTGVASNSTRELKPKEYCLKIGTQTHTTTKRRLGIFRRRKRHTTYTHTLYYQESDDKYCSITVEGLGCNNWVSGYNSNFSGNNEHLVIPIDRSLIFDLTKKEREHLYHHSLLINMLHVKVTKKKWYQTAFFQAVLFVAGVVISVLSGGVLSGGVGAVIKATAIAIAKGVAITLAVQLALKLAVKLGLNPTQVAIIALVVSIVATVYTGGSFDFTKILHAPNIMKALNSSFNFYQKMLNIQIADIQKQMQDMLIDYQNKEARLKETQKLLDTKVFELHHEMLRSSYTPSVDLFDTVEMFYARHNSYNVIQTSHGLITNYVEGSLAHKRGLYNPVYESVEDVLLIQ